MILITGASSGLGAALAKQYAQEGEQVVITGRSRDRLAAIAEKASDRITGIAADLSSPDSISSLFDSVEAPDKVIHCAGSGYFGPIETQSPEKISELIQNNLVTAALLLRELVSRYKEREISVAIVMSTAAQSAKAGESTYCAVKWGVKGLLESVRLELKGKKMKLIGIYPGGMATEFWSTSGKELDTSTFMSAEEAATMIRCSLINSENGYVSDITVNRS